MNGLNEALRRNVEGYMGAHEAAEVALRSGKLLVGTAVSLEAHTPTILLNADSGGWKLMHQNDRGGVLPAFRATNSADIAVWCGFGGNPNIPLQRLITPGIRPIIPESSACDLGTFGWDAPRLGPTAFKLHHESPAFTDGLSDREVIGAIDIVDAMACAREQSDEPGNFFVNDAANTIGTITVRMGDVRTIPFSTRSFADIYRNA